MIVSIQYQALTGLVGFHIIKRWLKRKSVVMLKSKPSRDIEAQPNYFGRDTAVGTNSAF
ncbi:hypothetical protein QWZ16_17725 [Vibrio ostreicida]|uniref:Uncharacterized protein n=1 Tax=Vibrio ostreicida TaxID=526588 RepID=A0ABT8BX96_9VIBR|nr:hypothetical protein [Vibrio ostreicida]MDN3611442.1 hypothetical protein [Vibrio ostreicida]